MDKKEIDINEKLSNLVRLCGDALRGAYNIGHKDGYLKGKEVEVQDARIEGRREAWELAKKIFLDTNEGGLTRSELINIFDSGSPSAIIIKYSASTALKMFEEYYRNKEKEKEKGAIESFDNLVKAYGADKVKEWFESCKR